MMTGHRSRTVLLVAGVTVLVAAGGAGAFLGTRAARGPDRPATHATVAAPSQLAVATTVPGGPAAPTGSAPAARADAVATQLRPALRAAGLGDSVHARVLDAATGRVLFDRAGATPVAPASTIKLVTATALLTVRDPADRITTRVVTDGKGTIAIVGGGDPTLSAAPRDRDPLYAGAARLSDLASAVKRAGVPVRRIVVDDTRFTGPTVSPYWADEDVPSSYGAAITAVMADGGRPTPDADERSATPDLDAGRSFARLLGKADLPVRRGHLGGASSLATVRSAPVSLLVEQMLRLSDNVIAECLARQVALATGRPGSFTGAVAAVRAAVRRTGIDPGAGIRDGSGLAATDRVTVRTLAGVLRLATEPDALRLRSVTSGLPVAGWSGTLAGRYVSGRSRSAAGVVRAKTGTLTGVSAVAGLVHDRSGRLLVFAVVADRNDSTPAAQSALDAVVTRLAACGCG